MDAVSGTSVDRKSKPKKRKLVTKIKTNQPAEEPGLLADGSSQPPEEPSKTRKVKKRRPVVNATNSESCNQSSTAPLEIGSASLEKDLTVDGQVVQPEALSAARAEVSIGCKEASLGIGSASQETDAAAHGKVQPETLSAAAAAASTAPEEASAQGEGGSVGADAKIEGVDAAEGDGGHCGDAKIEEEGAGLTLEERRALKRTAKKARKEAELLEKNLKDKQDAFTSNERKVFVGGINNEAEVRKKFGKCGKFSFFSFPKDKGIAFITFTTEKGMLAALELDGTGHKGRTINVKIAEHRKTIGDGKGKSKDKGKGNAKGTGGRGFSSLRALS